MTKTEYLALAESKWASLEALQSEENFYDYEKKFDKIMTDLGKVLLEQSLGEVPLDRRNKKKLKPDMEQ